jgi:hypothetical protein
LNHGSSGLGSIFGPVGQVFEIPLDGVQEQFSIDLAGKEYQLTLMWRDSLWFIDIADSTVSIT